MQTPPRGSGEAISSYRNRIAGHFVKQAGKSPEEAVSDASIMTRDAKKAVPTSSKTASKPPTHDPWGDKLTSKEIAHEQKIGVFPKSPSKQATARTPATQWTASSATGSESRKPKPTTKPWRGDPKEIGLTGSVHPEDVPGGSSWTKRPSPKTRTTSASSQTPQATSWTASTSRRPAPAAASSPSPKKAPSKPKYAGYAPWELRRSAAEHNKAETLAEYGKPGKRGDFEKWMDKQEKDQNPLKLFGERTPGEQRAKKVKQQIAPPTGIPKEMWEAGQAKKSASDTDKAHLGTLHEVEGEGGKRKMVFGGEGEAEAGSEAFQPKRKPAVQRKLQSDFEALKPQKPKSGTMAERIVAAARGSGKKPSRQSPREYIESKKWPEGVGPRKLKIWKPEGDAPASQDKAIKALEEAAKAMEKAAEDPSVRFSKYDDSPSKPKRMEMRRVGDVVSATREKHDPGGLPKRASPFKWDPKPPKRKVEITDWAMKVRGKPQESLESFYGPSKTAQSEKPPKSRSRSKASPKSRAAAQAGTEKIRAEFASKPADNLGKIPGKTPSIRTRGTAPEPAPIPAAKPKSPATASSAGTRAIQSFSTGPKYVPSEGVGGGAGGKKSMGKAVKQEEEEKIKQSDLDVDKAVFDRLVEKAEPKTFWDVASEGSKPSAMDQAARFVVPGAIDAAAARKKTQASTPKPAVSTPKTATAPKPRAPMPTAAPAAPKPAPTPKATASRPREPGTSAWTSQGPGKPAMGGIFSSQKLPKSMADFRRSKMSNAFDELMEKARAAGNPAKENGPISERVHGGKGPGNATCSCGPKDRHGGKGPAQLSVTCAVHGGKGPAKTGCPGHDADEHHGGKGPASTGAGSEQSPGRPNLQKALTAAAMPQMPRALAMQMDSWRSATDVLTRGNSRFAKDIHTGPLTGEVIEDVKQDEVRRTTDVYKSNPTVCGMCGRSYMSKSFPDGCPSCSIHKSSSCSKGHQMVKGRDGSLRCSICG